MKVIDTVVGLQTDETIAMRPTWARELFAGRFGADGAATEGQSLDAFVAELDDAGVDHAILFSPKAGPRHEPTSYRPDASVVRAAVERYPARFSGIIGVDPTHPMEAVGDIEHAVQEWGFVGVHAYPLWFDLPPDHRLWYPIYAKCVELDVPIEVQAGHCLVYTKQKPLRSVGRPGAFDQVACDFPELKLIAIHTGWPWQEEMISVAWKHENVYIATDAYAPKYWNPSLVRFIDSWGRGKVMYGTDYPVLTHRRTLDEIAELKLRDESLQALLSGTADRVFRLPDGP